MMNNNSISPILKAYMTIGPCFTLTGILLSLFATDEIRHLTQIIGFLFCFAFGSTMQILFIIHRKLLQQIISRILSTHNNYPNFIDKNITKKAERKAEEKSTVDILVYILTSSLWVLCPYLYLFTRPGIRLDHPDVQTIPYYYSMWKTDSILSFTIKKCMEVVASAAGLCTYYAFTVFITYTIHNLEAHSEEINLHLNNIIETHIRKYMKFNELSSTSSAQNCTYFLFERGGYEERKQYEKSIDEQFVKIIVYHNFIHRYVKW